MEYKNLDLPVAYDETFDILDASKVSAFMDCPRKFLFAYIFGWKQLDPNIHLEYGGAWHDAMEFLALAFKGNTDGSKRGYTNEEIRGAYRAFLTRYSQTYGDGPALEGIASLTGLPAPNMPAKDANNAFIALVDYQANWREDNFETLYTEVAGTVPISNDRLFHVKLDTILREAARVFSLEHKTTGRRTNAWLQQWATMLQVGGYSYFLKSLIDAGMIEGNFGGVEINGAILRAPNRNGDSNNEFVRVPIRPTEEQTALWLWEVNHWIDFLDVQMLALQKARAKDDVLGCFPRNPTSCNKFGCAYPGLCEHHVNPLKIYEKRPGEYKVEFWNPRRDDDAKYVADIAAGAKDIREML